MSAFTKIAATAALTLVASTASAGLIEVVAQTQTQTHASSLTTWLDQFTFNLFDAATAGGALKKIELSLVGSSNSLLTFNAQTDSYVSGSAGSNIFATISLGGGGLNINVSPADSFGGVGPGVFVPAGQSTQVGPLLGSDSTSSVTTSASDLAAFTGPGSFTVDLQGLGSLSLEALGGNVDTVQVTSSTATFEVAYFIEGPNTVPVPGTLALVGLGLLAMRARKNA